MFHRNARDVVREVARVESLEPRTLFATNTLSALFGGSALFARKDGGTNRLHATLHVDAQAAGQVSGRLGLDGLGDFSFDGTVNDDVIVLVLSSANGSGSLIASEKSDGMLSGELFGVIGNVNIAGSVRLHDNGGTVKSRNVAEFSGPTI